VGGGGLREGERGGGGGGGEEGRDGTAERGRVVGRVQISNAYYNL